MQSEVLIQILIEQTRVIINQLERLRNDDLSTLTWRENPTSWNILECIEHINRYGDFYLPEIASKIKTSNTMERLITHVKRKRVVTMLMAMVLELPDKAKRKEEKNN